MVQQTRSDSTDENEDDSGVVQPPRKKRCQEIINEISSLKKRNCTNEVIDAGPKYRAVSWPQRFCN